MARWWIGKVRQGIWKGCWNPFQSKECPTEESHGEVYSIVEGPFSKRTAAMDRINYAFMGVRVPSSETILSNNTGETVPGMGAVQPC